MKLRWSPEAATSLEMIVEFISKDNAAAARRVAKSIVESTEMLTEHPRLGRVGQQPGTREWKIGGLPYFTLYEIDEARASINVLNVIHSSRQWPPKP